MLTELITSAGPIEVVGVGGTETEAIESIRALKPDVVLLDLQLESGSGTNVLRAVRGEAELAGVRVLITSNHTAPQLKAACLDLGADGYFDKVKELGALTAKLGELAAARRGRP